MTYYTASFRDLSRMIKTAGSGGPAGLDAYGVNPPVKPKPVMPPMTQDQFNGVINDSLIAANIDPNQPNNPKKIPLNQQQSRVNLPGRSISPTEPVDYNYGWLSTIPRTGLEAGFMGMDSMFALGLNKARTQWPTFTPNPTTNLYYNSPYAHGYITNAGKMGKALGWMAPMGMIMPGVNLMNQNRTDLQHTVDAAALGGAGVIAAPSILGYLGAGAQSIGSALTPLSAAAAWPMAAYYGTDALVASPITEGSVKMNTLGDTFTKEENVELADRAVNPNSAIYNNINPATNSDLTPVSRVVSMFKGVPHGTVNERNTAYSPEYTDAMNAIHQWEITNSPTNTQWTNAARPIRDVVYEYHGGNPESMFLDSGLTDGELKDKYRNYLTYMTEGYDKREPKVYNAVHELINDPKYNPKDLDLSTPILVPAQPSGYVWSTVGDEIKRAKDIAARRVIAGHQAFRHRSPAANAWSAGFIWSNPGDNIEHLYDPKETYRVTAPGKGTMEFGPAGPRPDNAAYNALNDPKILDRLDIESNAEGEPVLMFNTGGDEWVPFEHPDDSINRTLYDLSSAPTPLN